MVAVFQVTVFLGRFAQSPSFKIEPAGVLTFTFKAVKLENRIISVSDFIRDIIKHDRRLQGSRRARIDCPGIAVRSVVKIAFGIRGPHLEGMIAVLKAGVGLR